MSAQGLEEGGCVPCSAINFQQSLRHMRVRTGICLWTTNCVLRCDPESLWVCPYHQAGSSTLHWVPGLPVSTSSVCTAALHWSKAVPTGRKTPARIICVGIRSPSANTVEMGATLVPQERPSRPGARSVLLKFEKRWDSSCNVAHARGCTLWLRPLSSKHLRPRRCDPTSVDHTGWVMRCVLRTLPPQPQALRPPTPRRGFHLPHGGDAGAARAVSLRRALRGETR